MPQLPAINLDSPLNPEADGLTEREKDLIDLIVTEGMNRTEAARRAGYSEKHANVAAYRVMSKPAAQGYLLSRLAAKGAVRRIEALTRLEDLSSKAKSEYVRLEATKEILDRDIAGNKNAQRSISDSQVTVRFELGDGN